MGAHVTVLSHSPGKREDALKLGADDFLVTSDAKAFKDNAERFDFIIDTVSAQHDYNAYLGLLKRDGTMVLVGVPEPAALAVFLADHEAPAPCRIADRRHPRDAGDARFLRRARHRLRHRGHPDRRDQQAYERMLKSDVRYRFVIDIASLR